MTKETILWTPSHPEQTQMAQFIHRVNEIYGLELKSYDELLNDKYKVTLNKKTIERVKNYFQ